MIRFWRRRVKRRAGFRHEKALRQCGLGIHQVYRLPDPGERFECVVCHAILDNPW